MPAPRRLPVLVGAIVLVDTMFFAAITPLLPSYVHAFGLSKSAAGVLAGAYPAGTLLGALPGGLLAARAGVRPTVLLGLGCLVGASLVFAFAPGVAVLDAARFVQGWGGAASWAGALSWLVAAVPRERRGTLIGGVFGTAIAGALLGPVLGALANLAGPGPAFCAVAALGAALALVTATTPASRPAGHARLADLRPALRDGRVVAATWLIGLPGLLFGTIGVLAPLRLAALGAGATAIATVFLVAAGLEASVSPIVGRLSDRRGRLAPVLVALAAVSVLLALLGAPTALGPLVALVLVTEATVGVLWAPASALLSDGAEAARLDQGLAFALLNLGWAVGQAAGSAGGAALAQATSDTLAYVLLALVCAGTVAVLARARARGRLAAA